jgi:hypothetical protein
MRCCAAVSCARCSLFVFFFLVTYPVAPSSITGTYYRGKSVYSAALDHVAPPSSFPELTAAEKKGSSAAAAAAEAAATLRGPSSADQLPNDDDLSVDGEDGVLVESAAALRRKQAASPALPPAAESGDADSAAAGMRKVHVFTG